MSKKVKWKSKPKTKDYDGAKSFLSLLCSEADCERIIDQLEEAPQVEHAAKDLLRAAALPLLSQDDPRVREDLKKVTAGHALPPVLLVRGDLPQARRLVVADGYHRICASYIVDEEAPICCRIIDAPPSVAVSS